MAWNIPVEQQRVLAVLDLWPAADATIVDLGCGSGELLGALAARGHRCRGVDRDPASIASGKRAFPAVDFHCGDANNETVRADLGICLGSTGAFGRGEAALPAALEAMAPCSWICIGEGFHNVPVPEGYARLLGPHTGIERTHLENVHCIEEAGFDVVHAITARPAEWDAFEWAFYRRKGLRDWRDGYLRWGRQVMGFGVYLARRTCRTPS